MDIKVYPDPVVRGSKVLLEASKGIPVEGYKYEWIAVNFGRGYLKPCEDNPTKCYVNTGKMNPGLYEVQVKATPEGEEEPSEVGEAPFSVVAMPISQEYIEGLVVKAAEGVASFKKNIDGKLDGISTAVGTAAGKARSPAGGVPVVLKPQPPTPDGDEEKRNIALWQTIRNRTDAIGFCNYLGFVDAVLCDQGRIPRETSEHDRLERHRNLIVGEFHGVDAYNLLRTATDAFLLLETGVWIPPELSGNAPGEAERLGHQVTFENIRTNLQTFLGTNGLPYLERIVRVLNRALLGYPECRYTLSTENRNRLIFDPGLRHPLMLELIWSYWHEEGMLAQSMNAVSLRFQNRRSSRAPDPLAHLELDPLRPLNNLLWGYIQEEYRRLTVQRRAYEYDHHYGLSLYGEAVRAMRPADSRSRFLEAYHNLLTLCTAFFKQADDTTVSPDPFPLLTALREVHLILAQGAHNQFGDLPWTARAEMLVQQWLLARPEMNEFLRARAMVPYEEEWMGRVDTMKSLQGWTDTTISHFRNLGVFGEQLLLSIRYTDWVGITVPGPARAWALYWRPEIQYYIHAYRAATGVDLTVDATAKQPAELRYARPSDLLRRRLGDGRAAPGVPAHQSFRERRAARK